MDYGDSRIGLSLSDLLGITAQPLEVLHVNNGWKNIVPVIHDIIKKMNIDKIVIGYPLLLKGTKGSRCETTDRFIEVLSKGIENIEIVRWDERYTSRQAKGILSSNEKKDGKNDIVSAVLILQSYLDFCRK